MKDSKFSKKILKTICISTFLFSAIFSGQVFGADFEVELSEEYKEWINLSDEEKKESFMPQTIYGEAPSGILEKYEFIGKPLYFLTMISGKDARLENVSEDILKDRYSLNEKVDLRVENQESTTECWAFSSLKALETNIALGNEIRQLPNFSERHMDYSTTKTFTDGVNPIGFNRELGRGGLPLTAYAYLTNGTGAVLEEDMPFENNETKISLSEINKNVDTIVTDYITLPTIKKEYETYGDGNTKSVTYTDYNGNEYTEAELKNARDIIKEQLVTNGAISSITAANKTQYYDKNVAFHASNYNCNSVEERRDHAVTIVGWDDNYSRENFRDGARPTSDGAYIVLNTYGEENFDNGYLYVSYEDFFIESEIYGVQSNKKVDYDQIYQHDFFGPVFKVTANGMSSGYYGVTFERNTVEKEMLNNVGVNLATYSKVEVYVNPNGTSMNLEDLIKVSDSQDVKSPGYHRIDIEPIELNSKEFAIVVKQISQNDKLSFQVETKVDGTAFENVTTQNRSYFSANGNVWQKLSDISVGGVDMNSADVCIKGFTTKVAEEPENPAIATITYNITETTNQDVIATINFDKENVTVDGENTYTFTENGSYTFNFVDNLGNSRSETATVSWIDKEAPIATIKYSTQEVTQEEVIATIEFNEENVTITNNDGSNTYTFSENGEFTFNFVDKAGNEGTEKAEVSWIEEKQPDKPIEPEDPGKEPDEPTNPEDPGKEPDEPTEPEDPGKEPDEPTEPEDPGKEPDEPTDPEDPGKDPEEPSKPEEKYFNSEKYKINDEYILNIEYSTKKSDFIKNISTNYEIKIFTEDDKEVTEDKEIIKTGMKIKLSDEKTYNLIVRGDINRDGKITPTDLSKIILHYNGNKGFEITNSNSLKACDMNFDGKITVTDVSQLIVLYNGID